MTDFKPSSALGDAYGLGLARWEVDGEGVGTRAACRASAPSSAYLPDEGLTLAVGTTT